MPSALRAGNAGAQPHRPLRQKKLHGYWTLQLGVERAIHHAHAACSQRGIPYCRVPTGRLRVAAFRVTDSPSLAQRPSVQPLQSDAPAKSQPSCADRGLPGNSSREMRHVAPALVPELNEQLLDFMPAFGSIAAETVMCLIIHWIDATIYFFWKAEVCSSGSPIRGNVKRHFSPPACGGGCFRAFSPQPQAMVTLFG